MTWATVGGTLRFPPALEPLSPSARLPQSLHHPSRGLLDLPLLEEAAAHQEDRVGAVPSAPAIERVQLDPSAGHGEGGPERAPGSTQPVHEVLGLAVRERKAGSGVREDHAVGAGGAEHVAQDHLGGDPGASLPVPAARGGVGEEEEPGGLRQVPHGVEAGDEGGHQGARDPELAEEPEAVR